MFKKPLSIILIMTLLLTSLVIAPVTAQAQPVQTSQTAANAPTQLGADNSLGEMFSTAVNREQNDGANGITDVSVNGTKATVTLNNEEACTVIVGIYDESDDTLLATAMQRSIAANAGTVTLTFSESLPQYYYLRAFILDSACCPLAKQYESSRYTRRFSGMMAKTVNDFTDAQVLNLDEDPENNFAVFDANVKSIETSDTVNIPSKPGEITYTFTDIDDSLRDLKAGDIFTFTPDGDPEIVKIAAITFSDNTATITSAKAELDEVFDYVKIDTTSVTEEPQIAPTGVDIDADYEYSKSITFDLDDEEDTAQFGLSGSIELGVTATLKLFYFDDIFEIEMVTEYGGTMSVGYSKKLERSFTIGMVKVPTPVFGVTFDIKVELELEAEAKATIETPLKGKVGFDYSSDGGFRSIYKKPEVDPEVKCEGTLYAGVKLSPTVDILLGTASAGIGGKVGVEAVATRSSSLEDYQQSDHLCDWCVEGSASVVFAAEVELEYGLAFLGVTQNAAINLATFKSKLFDFHNSSKTGFGFGVCKNRTKPQEDAGVDLTPLDRSDVPTSGSCTISQTVTYNLDFETDRNNDGIVDILDMNPRLITGRLTGTGLYTEEIYQKAVDNWNQNIIDKADFLYPESWVEDEFGERYDKNEYYRMYYTGFNSAWQQYPDGVTGWTAIKDIPPFPDNNFIVLRSPLKYLFKGFSFGSLVLPSTLKYIAGFNNVRIRKLNLPNSVEEIAASAFYNSRLQDLRMPTSLRRIGDYAFYNSPITHIDFNENLEYIGDYAFYNTWGFDLELPPSVQHIGSYAFPKCSFVTVPESVKEVGTHAFQNVVAATLNSEGKNIFTGCDKLLCATIGDNVTKLGDNVFKDCTAMKAVDIPENVHYIEAGAFRNSGLTKVTIPGTVRRIGEYAFADCQNLREVVLEEGVMDVDYRAFANCPKLERIYVPISISKLDENIFDGCPQIITLKYDGSVEEWNNVVAKYSFNYDTNEVTARRMSDLTDESSLYQRCTIYCWEYEDEDEGPATTGGDESPQTVPLRKGVIAATGSSPDSLSEKFAGAEYLIAVEDTQNGQLNGTVTALKQVKADENGCVDVTGIACPDGKYLNAYGACGHPSVHVTDASACVCAICGANVTPVLHQKAPTFDPIPDEPAPELPTDDSEPYKPEPLRKYGDADGDYKVTILDATAIQRKLADFIVEQYDELGADADADENVTILDATAVQRHLAGYHDDNPVNEIIAISSVSDSSEPIEDPPVSPPARPTEPPSEAPTETPTEFSPVGGDIYFYPGLESRENFEWFASVSDNQGWNVITGTKRGMMIVFPGAAEYKDISIICMPSGSAAVDYSNYVGSTERMTITGNYMMFLWWNGYKSFYVDFVENDLLDENDLFDESIEPEDILFDPGKLDEHNPVWFAKVRNNLDDETYIEGVRLGTLIDFPGAAGYEYIQIFAMPTGSTVFDMNSYSRYCEEMYIRENYIVVPEEVDVSSGYFYSEFLGDSLS